MKCDGSWSGLGLSENSDVFQLRLSGKNYGDYTLKVYRRVAYHSAIKKGMCTKIGDFELQHIFIYLRGGEGTEN